MFNALRYKQDLEEAGFTGKQAEATVKGLIDVMNDNFATKSDLKELDLRLTAKIDSLALRMESGFKEQEYKLTIKLGTIVTVAIGVTTAIVKLLQTN